MSESSMAGRTRRLRIGVLDNDSCALEYIVAMLKQSTGSESNIADVWAYTKPAQAVQECRFGQHTDILIVDMALNGLTGAQVAAEIRRISPDTGIIGITSYPPEVNEQALAAADELAVEGVSAEVIDAFSVKPLDRATIVASARKTGRVVVAEEHSIHGGLGTAVSRALAEECPVPMRFVGMDDRFGKSGEFEELMAYFGLDSKAIVKAVKSLTLK